MHKTALALLAFLLALPGLGGAQEAVAHAPLDPAVEPKVRAYVHDMAFTVAAFYPETVFRNVRAVYFPTGAVIVCGELNRTDENGQTLGWRYFSNSGPLIYESETLEVLCDRRTYPTPSITDDHEYGPEFTLAARR
jgi:hypothetical protein